LLKSGYGTLLASLVVVALLAIPGRSGAAVVGGTFAYGSIGPIAGPAALGVYDNTLAGLIGDSFVDHFTFTVVPSNSFTVTTLLNQSLGVTFTSADLMDGTDTTTYATGVPFAITSSPLLAPGSYDLRVTGTLTATTGMINAAVNFNTAPIPEPETYAMMLAGLGMMGFVARRRKQKQTA
jgi:hypothetical protein